MNMLEALQEAKSRLTECTGLKCTGVVRALKTSEGWQVNCELLEMSRIPPSTDVLGMYEVSLGPEGDITTFEKKGMRLRGEPSREQKP
ncbi:MAG: gas vesicle protein GvpO [Chloroflexota bacterium]